MLNETIAHHRILRKLGNGRMGVVDEAEDSKLGRRVALNHSGICTIHAIEEHQTQTFIAMELLEGLR